MKDTQEALETRLVALRSAFDAAFARKAEPPPGQRRGYLGIRLNDAPYALDLDEVASVKKQLLVTALPSDEPHLLGVAGFAGTLTAVYDLSALLGLPSFGAPGWFALVRDAPVVLAFHALEGQLTPDPTAAAAETADAGDVSSEVIFRPGITRPVIRLSALVARLRSVVKEGRRKGAASR
jgi:hypothetical protein